MASREEFLALLRQYAPDDDEENENGRRAIQNVEVNGSGGTGKVRTAEKEFQTEAFGNDKTNDYAVSALLPCNADPPSATTSSGQIREAYGWPSSSFASSTMKDSNQRFLSSSHNGIMVNKNDSSQPNRFYKRVGFNLLHSMHQRKDFIPPTTTISNDNDYNSSINVSSATPTDFPTTKWNNYEMSKVSGTSFVGGGAATLEGFTREDDDGEVERKRTKREEARHAKVEKEIKSSFSFKTVESYKPLSSGGFLDSVDGSPDRARCMVIGAVVVVAPLSGRCAPPSSSSSTTSTTAATTTSAAMPTMATTGRVHQATTVDRGLSYRKDAPGGGGAAFSSSSSSCSPPSTLSSSVDVLKKIKQFVPESALSTEEKKYGRTLDPELLHSLAEVTRCDAHRREVEVLFLSGQRRKFPVLALRPAGFMERELFKQWKDEPSLQPVNQVGLRRRYCSGYGLESGTSLTSEPSGKSDGSGRVGGMQGKTTGDLSSSLGLSAVQPSTPFSPTSSYTPTAIDSPPHCALNPSSWWVLPRLIVRVVAADAGPSWFRQKAVVLHIQRKEERMRLVRAEAASQGSHGIYARGGGGKEGDTGGISYPLLTSSPLPTSKYRAEDLVDVFGLLSVETVVPRVGEVGMLVLGKRKGELVVVVRRCRDEKTGELQFLSVVPRRSAFTFQAPEERRGSITVGSDGKNREDITHTHSGVSDDGSGGGVNPDDGMTKGTPSLEEESFDVLPEEICALQLLN